MMVGRMEDCKEASSARFTPRSPVPLFILDPWFGRAPQRFRTTVTVLVLRISDTAGPMSATDPILDIEAAQDAQVGNFFSAASGEGGKARKRGGGQAGRRGAGVLGCWGARRPGAARTFQPQPSDPFRLKLPCLRSVASIASATYMHMHMTCTCTCACVCRGKYRRCSERSGHMIPSKLSRTAVGIMM